jgi:hypothetical protein
MKESLGSFWDEWEKETREEEKKLREMQDKIHEQYLENLQEAERMKEQELKEMKKRYNFSVDDERIQIALERLESLAVDSFRNNDYCAQKSFDDVWWSVLHEVDMYREGEEHGFKSVRSVQATEKWLKSFSHLCTEKVPDEYKIKEVK